MQTHINKRYVFTNEITNQNTVLELDLGAQEVSVLVYEGVEQEYPYVAALKPEHNTVMLMAVLDLFTQGRGITRIEYITIPGA